MFKKVLAATDGSDHALRAVEAAARLAQATGARLAVVSVVHVPRLYRVDLGPELTEGFRDSARKALDEARRATGDGSSVTYRMLEGEPAAEIARLVRDEGFDLVVLGRRGMGGSSDRSLGGISERVMREADCSVMLVR
jgi:nucleotide-binding universal stress UspA family protein